MEFAAVAKSAELLDQEPVAGHVCIFHVSTASALLHHQFGIAIAQNSPDADLLRQPDAMHQCFILGDIVGCSNMDLQYINELVTLGGCEDDTSP